MTKTTLVKRPRRQVPNRSFTGMERFFDEFFGAPLPRGDEGLTDRPWRPAVDVRETEVQYEVSAELPGLTKDDVEITFDNGVLNFKGERQSQAEEGDDKSFHRIERRYGSFSRSFVLPTEVDTERVAASFKNGVLTITLPKAERARSHKININ